MISVNFSIMRLCCYTALLCFLPRLSAFAASNISSTLPTTWEPLSEYDEYYMNAVRVHLGTFHENLSKGLYSSNGPLVALGADWNYDGNLVIGRAGFVEALTAFVNTSLRGLDIRDVHRVVDGRYGATLYSLQGEMSGEFFGVPYSEGTRFNAYGTELWVFDGDALLTQLITVDQVGILRGQMNNTLETPPFTPHDPPLPNPQTTAEYRALLRESIQQFHANVNTGQPEKNAAYASAGVEINENDVVSYGRDAFVRLVSSEHAGQGAFPKKVFHDDYILADGHIGVVEYVWQGQQQGGYPDTNITGAIVRQRGMVYFYFDESGLVTKAVAVFDEFAVATQVLSEGQYRYP